ncbi:large ribosomal subunit protein mL53-like isoform X2 [Babylonia areolata]|uniref:large ribosomal subunit protein mL53-like n=1 Tax=Babylonia areolata TaxID=304850 RepID=UPI003FD11DD5
MAHRRIAKMLKMYHLRPVKSMKFTFDPYTSNVRSIREVLFQMHTPRIVNTNQNTYLKVDVKSDGTEPAIDVIFVDGHRLLMKTKHLSTVEILDRLWEFCDAKDPKKGEAPALQTKAGKTKRR